jgi:hypothetical protein
MLRQFPSRTPVRYGQWHRWEKDLNDLHEAIRDVCVKARRFLEERQETVKPRRGKPRLPRRAGD